MRRRALIGCAGAALFSWPLVARAQQPVKVARLGYLGFGAPAASANRVEALRAGLRDLGYVEGKNLVIEFRRSGTVEQMHEAVAELARMKVDVIFASSSTETEPARRATSTIPRFDVNAWTTSSRSANGIFERSCRSTSTTTMGPGPTYRWRRTRPSREVCSHRARAGCQ